MALASMNKNVRTDSLSSNIQNLNIVDDLVVRINGTMPDFSIMGDEEKSERAAEVKRMERAANTSCSIFTRDNSLHGENRLSHLLVDVGEGVVKSIEDYIADVAATDRQTRLSHIPNVVLLTHSHDDHIKELPLLASKASASDKLNIYCTNECRDQIITRFGDRLVEKQSVVSFNNIQPGVEFQVGPFSILPVLALHGEDSPPGSVIYIVRTNERKIIFGWDFLTLPEVNENLLWNPDLLILGTQSYNPHPETGMISVSDAYQLVRRWNAKECYLVHYRGLMDFQESKNQWFKGPVKAMTATELQKNVDSHLGISGDNGRFKITVAKEGMTWIPKSENKNLEYQVDENVAVGNIIEIESLENYVFKIEKPNKEDKLKIEIEDRINRYTLQFDRPRKDKNNDLLIRGAAEKGMLAKGPELKMELIMPTSGEQNQKQEHKDALSINAFKGKKYVFQDTILISNRDAQRLRKYIQENFR
jgi:phosphoribosyl 1,2-cyclic phosphodiesterase